MTAVVFLSGCMSSGNMTLVLAPQVGFGETAHFPTNGSTANYESDRTPKRQANVSARSTVATSYAAPVRVQVPAAVVPEPAETDSAADTDKPQPDGQTGDTVAAVTAADKPPSKAAEAAPTAAASANKKSPGPLARLFSFGKPRPSAEIEIFSAETSRETVSTPAASKGPRKAARKSAGSEKLPGVRLNNLFGIGKRNASNVQAPVQVASAAGLARLAPNGLRRQHNAVSTACLKPPLLNLLASVRRHYGRDVVITSGFRSSKHNRRIGGARASRHTTCDAADIQVPGVSKWELAKYLRTVRGPGGVGTYCHTRSVHIDVGSRRDWNWRCKRR
ncbi:MAG: YcbK family protein [Hyphomicrobiales bacterium]|nr:YcbK family protein [Hyphomicrobiales bacterium]MCP4999065.1 YcbK family protein [Hyphomicrobiales bacterium]